MKIEKRTYKILLFFLLIFPSYSLIPCSTPTWLYTLLMIPRNRYTLFYFYSGKENQSDVSVNKYIKSIANGEKGNANLSFIKIDVTKITQKEDNEFVYSLWKRHSKKDIPLYVMITSRYREIYSGDLDIETVKSFIGSPKRIEIADQLIQGKHGLFLILLTDDNKKNKRVIKTVKRVIDTSKDVGFLTLDRNNQEEKWLVNQLLLSEPGIEEIDEPMVFTVLGRGYVLPPFFGDDIDEDGISGIIEFIEGPCSCYLREAIYYGGRNSGMYLLTNTDWQGRSLSHEDEYDYTYNSYNQIMSDSNMKDSITTQLETELASTEKIKDQIPKKTDEYSDGRLSEVNNPDSIKKEIPEKEMAKKEALNQLPDSSEVEEDSIKQETFKAITDEGIFPIRLTLFIGVGMFLVVLASSIFILLRRR